MDFQESLQNIKNKMEIKEVVSTDIKKDSNSSFEKLSLSCLKSNSNKPYNSSEKEALLKGFVEIEEEEAYNNRYFIKDGLIWIHNIEALKSKLNIYNEDELRYMKYDVDTYYQQDRTINPKVKTKLRTYDEKDGSGNSAFDVENMVYLSDGVYIHKNDCWF